MSKYVESNLIRDEKIVLKAKINLLALLKDFVICAVIIAIGIVVKVMAFSNAGRSELKSWASHTIVSHPKDFHIGS